MINISTIFAKVNLAFVKEEISTVIEEMIIVYVLHYPVSMFAPACAGNIIPFILKRFEKRELVTFFAKKMGNWIRQGFRRYG